MDIQRKLQEAVMEELDLSEEISDEELLARIEFRVRSFLGLTFRRCLNRNRM